MELKELIKKDFGVDLPISGGTGDSIDNPIVIHRKGINDYVGTEYSILKYIGIGRGIEWETTGQQLMEHNGRQIDQIEIKTRKLTPDKIYTTTEKFYFDITECFGPDPNIDPNFNLEEALEKVKQRLLEMAQEDDFKKKCIDMVNNGELLNNYKNTDLLLKFLDVLREDESYPIYQRIRINKKLPVLDVLRKMEGEMR